MKNSWKRQAETELYIWESEIKNALGSVGAWEALLFIIHSLEIGFRRRKAGERIDFLKRVCGYRPTKQESENGTGEEDRPEQVDS
jgi:hypothetical protein